MIDIPLELGVASEPLRRGAYPPLSLDTSPLWRRRRERRSNERVLRSSGPSAAIEVSYRRELDALIDKMHRSTVWWIRAEYRANPPKIAQDDFASFVLRSTIRKLRRKWLGAFNAAADKLAKYFARDVSHRTDTQLKKILRDGGFTVKWEMTPGQKDVVGAIVAENVALIKSIPQEYLNRVEGMVMRSVQTGRDLSSLYDDLRKNFDITHKRAELIARDQNNKATSLLQRARFVESGIEECVWMHSSAGRHPRPSHVKAGLDKVRFDPKNGWLDPDEGIRIWPGYLINCRCTCRPVIKGFE